MAQPFIYLASCCYGGLAHARFMRSVLALRAECARRDIALQLDLGGGEALISRARAGMLARFLATTATHLLFVDGDQAFEAEEIFELTSASEGVLRTGGLLIIGRDAAQWLIEEGRTIVANFSDVHGMESRRTSIPFEAITVSVGNSYLPDLEAFVGRWNGLTIGRDANLNHR